MIIKKKKLNMLCVLSIVIGLVIPLFIINFGYGLNSQTPNTSALSGSDGTFARENFDPLLNSPKQGLGNISVTDINFNQDGYTFLGGFEYDGLYDDLGRGKEEQALNITYNSTKFLKTEQAALVQNLNESTKDKQKSTIEINETINVRFNQSQSYNVEGYLIYTPRLYPCTFKRLHIRENPTESSKYLNEGNYSVDQFNFMKFSYDNYFNGAESGNFTLHMIWEYKINVNEWELVQEQSESLELDSKINSIKPEFNYKFTIFGKRFNDSDQLTGTYPFTEYQIPAEDLLINFTVNMPDMALLNYTEIRVNGVTQTEEDVVNPDKSIQLEFDANNSQVEVEFNTEFEVEFKYAIKNSWGVDRLVSSKNIRERIFFPSIISGPSQIFVKNLIVFDTTINNDQVTKNSTQFGRSFPFYRANITVVEEEMKNSLVFTENTTKRKGIKLNLPYLIRGEICPSVIRYRASSNLRVIITDSSFMSVSNIEIKLFYNEREFGTYISKNRTQPLPKLLTDDDGEVVVENVPNGNYTLQVILNNNNILETSVSPENEINYVRTSIPHLPVLGIIFGIVSLSLFFTGYLLYRKYKKND
ncbi:MAG: hypothetical protein ACOC44_07310 [Promethearchaeia archaeon]